MATFKLDLQQNYDFDLSSFQNFEESIKQQPPAPSLQYNNTQKAITFLQKYLSGQKSLKGTSVPRREFFMSDQFINTFTKELELLQIKQAPETYQILKSEQLTESKSGITLFLDAIFRKEGGESWRKNIFQKNLVESGTLCKYVQPIVRADINIDLDYKNPAIVQAHFQNYSTYVNGLDTTRGPGARQDNGAGSQLFNYNFNPHTPGFNIQGTCYLCGTAIGPGGPGPGLFNLANCEHIMPILSALQASDFFLSKTEVYQKLSAIKAAITPGSNPTDEQLAYIDKLLKNSPEFAWSHKCCNMLKSDVDFLYLDTNNGQYQPCSENIDIYLNWLFHPINAVSYDCGLIIQKILDSGGNLDAARANARASIMVRVNQLCHRLNTQNGPVYGDKKELLKVYGIFLLLQHLKVSTINTLVGQIKLGGGYIVTKKKPIKKRILSGGANRFVLVRTNSGNYLYDKDTGKKIHGNIKSQNELETAIYRSEDAKDAFYSKVTSWETSANSHIKGECIKFASQITDESIREDNSIDDIIRTGSKDVVTYITERGVKITDWEKPWAESMFYDYMRLLYTRRKLTEYHTNLANTLTSLTINGFCLFWMDIPDTDRDVLLRLLIFYATKEDSSSREQCYYIIKTILVLCYDYNREICKYLSKVDGMIVINIFEKIRVAPGGVSQIWRLIPPFLQLTIFSLTDDTQRALLKSGIYASVTTEITDSVRQIDTLTQELHTLQSKIVEEVNSFRTVVTQPNVSLGEYFTSEETLTNFFKEVVDTQQVTQRAAENVELLLPSQQMLHNETPYMTPYMTPHGGKLIRKRKTTRRNGVVIKRKKHNKSRRHKTRKHKTCRHKMRRHKRSS